MPHHTLYHTQTPCTRSAPPTPHIYTLSLHDALPILQQEPVAEDHVGGQRDRRKEKAQRDECMHAHPRVEQDIHSSRWAFRSEEHTSELQSRFDLVCRLLLEKKKHQKCYLHKVKHTGD